MKTISPKNKFMTSEEDIINLSGYTKIDPKKDTKKKKVKNKKSKKVKNIKITKHKRIGILDALANSVKVKVKKNNDDSEHADEIVKTGVDIVTSIISAIKK